jgi:anti-sigma regulatory factor (Ser/Thr protein kinase)
VGKQPVTASDVQIGADPDAPRTARRFSAGFLADFGLDREARWAPLLIVSELVTNVVRHGGATMVLSLSVDADAHLRIAVYDNGGGHVAAPPEAAVSGRGLDIVDTLSTAWGVDQRDSGKTVWSELDLNHLTVS